jgi:Fe-S cluster assembly protein SufB
MKTVTENLPASNGNEVGSDIERAVLTDYKYGFVTDIEADEAPMGLN